MDVSNDTALLTEYVQWKAAQEVARPDTSPEEFMRDRMKQVAFLRVEEALAYISQCGFLRMEPNKHTIKAILEGTYVEAEPGGPSNGSTRNEPLEIPETNPYPGISAIDRDR